MIEFTVVVNNILLVGRVMTLLKTHGLILLIWQMLRMQLISIGPPCLGSQGLGGGVVLRLELCCALC